MVVQSPPFITNTWAAPPPPPNSLKLQIGFNFTNRALQCAGTWLEPSGWNFRQITVSITFLLLQAWILPGTQIGFIFLPTFQHSFLQQTCRISDKLGLGWGDPPSTKFGFNFHKTWKRNTEMNVAKLSSSQVQCQSSWTATSYYPATRASIFEPFQDYLGSWYLVWKLYSTKHGQITN